MVSPLIAVTFYEEPVSLVWPLEAPTCRESSSEVARLGKPCLLLVNYWILSNFSISRVFYDCLARVFLFHVSDRSTNTTVDSISPGGGL